MENRIKPLYRKVNTKAHGVGHRAGSSAKYDRNTKNGIDRSYKGKDRRGLDYTPLYKFLLSKIGQDWDSVYSEAISRLDREEPVFYLVQRNEHEKTDYVRVDESTFYNALFIDGDNKLQKVNENFRNEDLQPFCACCTHTFNGKPLVNKYIE